MTSVDLPAPQRVLAIGAHPDDIEFGAAATLAKWAAAGAQVHMLVVTDGSKGTWDRTADTATLVATRRVEQGAAAGVIGAAGVHFGSAVDGELAVDPALEAAVCEVLRRVRPDVVLAHDPWRRHRIHPDHARAGEVAVRAIVAARDPHFFADQGLEPVRPATALFFESDAADHVETVEPAHAAAKIDALLAHRTQWRSTMGIDDDPARQRARFVARVTAGLRAAGGRVGRSLGEAFLRVDGW
jgi:LmbE family N-acetylglucosaminyl deacetylase